MQKKVNLEIAANQPTINIGTIGHVAHGKSTLVRSISGTKTVRFKSELERNITIKLGYANAKIYKCSKCPRPICYQTHEKNKNENKLCKNENCGEPLELVKHVSFIDCPGHDILMATMLTGASIMDYSILLVAANEECPQPQTKEHLFAVEIMNIETKKNKNVLVVQNKIDLIEREKCLEQYDQIKEFLDGSCATESPIVPVVAETGLNVCAVLDFIVNYFKEPERKEGNPKMAIIRSFDVNKPGIIYKKNLNKNIKGGVLGGSLIRGSLEKGQEVEIRPGILKEVGLKKNCRICENKTEFEFSPFFSKIKNMKSEETPLEVAHPGGLIGLESDIDPFYAKGDKLVGMVIGEHGKMPDVFDKIKVKYSLFKKLLTAEIKDLNLGEQVLLNIGSTTTAANCTEICDCVGLKDSDKSDVAFDLTTPVCADIGEKIAISRRMSGHWRLIGYGNIVSGNSISVSYSNKIF